MRDTSINPEANEISDDDLAAAAEIFDRLKAVELAELQARESKPKKKPFTLCVKVELFYEFPAEEFPPWATELGVEKMAEEAFEDSNCKLTLEFLGESGLFKRKPAEISLDSVYSA